MKAKLYCAWSERGGSCARGEVAVRIFIDALFICDLIMSFFIGALGSQVLIIYCFLTFFNVFSKKCTALPDERAARNCGGKDRAVSSVD